MSNFQKSTLESMNGYKRILSDLQKQSEQLEKDCSNALQAADQDVEKILNIAKGLIDLNDNLFEKVVCIDDCLTNDEKLSQKAVDQLKEILKDDIAKQREYQARVNSIEWNGNKGFNKEQRELHNQDLER